MSQDTKRNSIQIALYSLASALLMSIIVPTAFNMSGDYMENRKDMVALKSRFETEREASKIMAKSMAEEAREFRKGVLDQLKLTNENLSLVNKNIAETSIQNMAFMLDCMNEVNKLSESVVKNSHDIAACQKEMKQ
jgi:hypothetical protein